MTAREKIPLCDVPASYPEPANIIAIDPHIEYRVRQSKSSVRVILKELFGEQEGQGRDIRIAQTRDRLMQLRALPACVEKVTEPQVPAELIPVETCVLTADLHEHELEMAS